MNEKPHRMENVPVNGATAEGIQYCGPCIKNPVVNTVKHKPVQSRQMI